MKSPPYSSYGQLKLKKRKFLPNRILVILAILACLVGILLFVFTGGISKADFTVTGPVGYNASKSRLIGDDLYFYTGSSIARQSLTTGDITEITRHQTMPAVLSVEFTDKYAILKTANHTPGTLMFSQLFNDPALQNSIKDQHFWLLNYDSGEFKHLSKGDVRGEPTSSHTTPDGKIRISFHDFVTGDSPESEHIRKVTRLYEYDELGVPTEIATLDGHFWLLSSFGDYSLLIGDSYLWVDHTSGQQIRLESQILSGPILLENGDFIAASASGDSGSDLPVLDENDHGLEADGTYLFSVLDGSKSKLTEHSRTVIPLGSRTGAAVLAETGSDSYTLFAFRQEMGELVTSRLEVRGLEGFSVSSLYMLDNKRLVVVGVLGEVFLASSGGAVAPVVPAPEFSNLGCNNFSCLESIFAGSALKVRVFDGDFEEGRSRVLEELRSQGRDPTQFKITWQDHTNL